jgi:lipocalin-like protein
VSQIGRLAIFAIAMAASGVMTQNALGQQRPLKEQLVGTWTLVSWEQTNTDGSKSQQFGASPKGIAFFDTAGHYIISVMRSERANYAIDNFGQLAQITAEEGRATAQGTITYFGTYSVSEADRIISIHVEGSSFPNWNGTNLERLVEITQDQLKLTVRPPRGGSVDVLWKRAGS